MSINDLNQRFPIVKVEDGTPTDYLMRILHGNNVANEDVETIVQELLARRIIAGDGLDGGGDLSADVTLTANVQEILDAISTTQGTLLYRNASDWVSLAPGTSGQFLKTLGSGANPAWATVGGGLYPINVPTASMFGTQHLGTGVTLTLTDTTYGVDIVRTDGGGGAAERVGMADAAIPGSTWTAILGVLPVGEPRLGYYRLGLGCTDGTKCLAIMYNTQNGAPLITSFYHATLNSFTSAVSGQSTYSPGIIFFKMVVDATNITTSYSFDGGVTYIDPHVRAKASFLTPTHVGLYLESFNAFTASKFHRMHVVYWSLT